jgi:hypothetical protein
MGLVGLSGPMGLSNITNGVVRPVGYVIVSGYRER